MLVRLTMISAAATAANRKGLFPTDEPLESRALSQLRIMRQTLRRADRVYSAPAIRARQTAEALSLEAVVEPLLAEQDYGRWAGQSLEHVQSTQPDGLAAWLGDPDSTPHGGESLSDLARRATAFLDPRIAEGGHTIAVTHASIVRAAIVHVLGAPLSAFWKIDIEPMSITEFRSDGRRWVLRASGVTVPVPAGGV
jgi:broad specificity phosphatase PhoE